MIPFHPCPLVLLLINYIQATFQIKAICDYYHEPRKGELPEGLTEEELYRRKQIVRTALDEKENRSGATKSRSVDDMRS
jgi:hypothetical protein